MKIVKIFFKIINFKRASFIYLFFLMFIAMILETLGLGLLIPTISFITNSDLINNYPFILNFLSNIKENTYFDYFIKDTNVQNQFLSVSLVLLACVYIFKNILLTFITWNIADIISKFQSYWPNKLFSIYLNQPYYFHVKNNSSLLIRNVTNVQKLINGVRSFATFILEFLTFIAIVTFLIYFQTKTSLLVILIFSILFIVITGSSKKILNRMGKNAFSFNAKNLQHIQQGLAGIKELKIIGKEKYFSNLHKIINHQLAKINRNVEFISDVPKYIIESVVILLLTIPIIISVNLDQSVNSLVTVIGVYSVCLFRILPAVNKMIHRLQHLRFVSPAINSIYHEFNLDNHSDRNNKNKIKFNQSIHFNNINFSYEESTNFILKNVEIKINKNDVIGISGPTGSGKSTLINVLNGLLAPTSGTIYVDGIDIQKNLYSWRRKIGYVPQNVFLLDDTILKNVAFGVEDSKIDIDLVNKSLKEAQLKEKIETLPEGLSTIVGERGSKLSGGEIQRIGIARALYNNSELLIFDEFTNNLDLATEQKILEIIYNFKGKKTIVIISHKLETMKICEKIFKIKNGLVNIN